MTEPTIIVVVPWYGTDIPGGAEAYAIVKSRSTNGLTAENSAFLAITITDMAFTFLAFIRTIFSFVHLGGQLAHVPCYHKDRNSKMLVYEVTNPRCQSFFNSGSRGVL